MKLLAKLLLRIKQKLQIKTIKDLNIRVIDDSYLITLSLGLKLYRRVKGDPLEFCYNDTTFTTKVLPEDRQLGISGINSGSSSMITTVRGALAESNKGEGRKLYQVTVIKPIDRIIDLDRVCDEQGIESKYLHIYNTDDGRDRGKEKELFNLYGKEIHERRIHGIKYRSRRSLDDTCYMFYDTIPDLNDYFIYREITDKINGPASNFCK